MNVSLLSNAGEKTMIGLFASVISYIWLHDVTSLLAVLAMLLVIDFITGFVAGVKKSGFDKHKVASGALAKVGIIGIIALAFIGDYTVYQLMNTLGVNILNVTIIGDLPLAGALGFAVIIYFIGSEGYSSLQNLLLWGSRGPDWLLKIFSLMRDTAGEIVKVGVKDDTQDSY